MWLAVVCKQKPDYERRQFVILLSRQNIIAFSTVAKPIMLFCYYKGGKKKIRKSYVSREYFTFVFVH